MNAITLYRVGRWCHQRRVPIVPKLTYYLIFVLYNSSIPMAVEIGEGARFAYGAMGVVLHDRCRIGRRVLIGQQVTIGGRARQWGAPIIEDHCYLGAGAKIIGDIRVGPCSVVGANAVVIEDVPPHSVVAGVPARVIHKDIRIEDYMTEDPPGSGYLGVAQTPTEYDHPGPETRGRRAKIMRANRLFRLF